MQTSILAHDMYETSMDPLFLGVFSSCTYLYYIEEELKVMRFIYAGGSQPREFRGS